MAETYLLGQTVELETQLLDGGDDTVVPMAAASLFVKKPSSGTFDPVTVTLSSDGTLATARVTVDEVGEWLTRWEVSGPPDAVAAGRFMVTPDQRLPARMRTVAERGERGPIGATGPAGPPGPVGPVGPDGEIPCYPVMPTSGIWEKGQIALASEGIFDAAGRRLLGWQRETDGTGYLPGVDWTALYVDAAPGPGYLLTEDGARLTAEDDARIIQESGGTEPKKVSQLPVLPSAAGAEILAVQAGVTGRLAATSILPTRFAPFTTSDATPRRITTDGAAASAANIGVLAVDANGQNIRALRLVVRAARTTTGGGGAAGDGAIWVLDGLLLSRALSVTTTQLAGGGAGLVPTRSRGGGSAYLLDVTADTTNGGINITATGAAGTTVEWNVEIASL